MAKLVVLCVLVISVLYTQAANECTNLKAQTALRPSTNTPYVPDCDSSGLFKPKQCLGNWCFCVNQYGTAVGHYMVKNTAAGDMNCRCAMDENDGISSSICMPNGNYPTQCILSARSKTHSFKQHTPSCEFDGSFTARQCNGDRCWCAYKDTGRRIGSYGSTTEEDASRMICDCARTKESTGGSFVYKCDGIGNYEGPCLWYNRKTHTNKQCDAQGFFKPVQCYKNTCYCVSKDEGYVIERFGFQKNPSGTDSNCQCAVDKWRYVHMGQHMNIDCLGDGSYKKCSQVVQEYTYGKYHRPRPLCNSKDQFLPKECDSKNCYCVNEYGHKIAGYSTTVALAPSEMACECARDLDTFIRSDKGNVTMNFKCTGTGDYYM